MLPIRDSIPVLFYTPYSKIQISNLNVKFKQQYMTV